MVAATNASGQVVERYAYSSIYGVASVKDAAGADRFASAEIGNPWRFQGRRFDQETGFYYFRLRYLDPGQGRFVNRDPIGTWGDAANVGNAYTFCGNDPVNGRDPFGLWMPRGMEPGSPGVPGWYGQEERGYDARWYEQRGGIGAGPRSMTVGELAGALATGVGVVVVGLLAWEYPLVAGILVVLQSGATNKSSDDSDLGGTLLAAIGARGGGASGGVAKDGAGAGLPGETFVGGIKRKGNAAFTQLANRQLPFWSCVPTAFGEALALAGVRIRLSVEGLITAMRTSTNGTYMNQAITTLRGLGVRIREFGAVTVDDIAAASPTTTNPMVVVVKNTEGGLHAVVVDTVKRLPQGSPHGTHMIGVRDPSGGVVRWVSEKEFSAQLAKPCDLPLGDAGAAQILGQ